jgi:hypothetical protein
MNSFCVRHSAIDAVRTMWQITSGQFYAHAIQRCYKKNTNNTSVGEQYSQVKTKGRDLANKTREPFKERGRAPPQFSQLMFAQKVEC